MNLLPFHHKVLSHFIGLIEFTSEYQVAAQEAVPERLINVKKVEGRSNSTETSVGSCTQGC